MTKNTIKNVIEDALRIGNNPKVVAQIMIEHPRSIRTVVKLLEDDDERIRRGAVWALLDGVEKGFNISSAIPSLVNRLEDTNKKVQISAAMALWKAAENKINISAAIPALTKLVDNTDSDIIRYGVEALKCAAKNGEDISIAVCLLINSMGDGKFSFSASKALEHAAANEKSSAGAIAALTTALGNSNLSIRSCTARVLSNVANEGVDISAAVEGLAKLLGESNKEVRWTAHGALEIAAEKSYVDLPLVGTSLAEYVARVSETGSPEEVLAAQNEAAESYSRIAAAASKRMNNSVEMAGEMLRPSIRPITPRGWNPGMLRQQAMERAQGRREMAGIATGRTNQLVMRC